MDEPNKDRDADLNEQTIDNELDTPKDSEQENEKKPEQADASESNDEKPPEPNESTETTPEDIDIEDSSLSDDSGDLEKSLDEPASAPNEVIEPEQTSDKEDLPESDTNSTSDYEHELVDGKEAAKEPVDDIKVMKEERHSPVVIILAVLVMLLLLGVAVFAYMSADSNNADNEINESNTSDVADPNVTPVTEEELNQELNNIDSTINELEQVGDPVDELDDSSLEI